MVPVTRLPAAIVNHRARRNTAGFTYTEVLVAAAILALALVPALQAMRTAPQGAGIYAQAVEQDYRLVMKMEELLSESFGALAAEASTPGSPTASAVYSDPGAEPARRLVFITAYDGDNADADGDPFTGTDADLLWLRVEIDSTNASLEALTAP